MYHVTRVHQSRRIDQSFSQIFHIALIWVFLYRIDNEPDVGACKYLRTIGRVGATLQMYNWRSWFS